LLIAGLTTVTLLPSVLSSAKLRLFVYVKKLVVFLHGHHMKALIITQLSRWKRGWAK